MTLGVYSLFPPYGGSHDRFTVADQQDRTGQDRKGVCVCMCVYVCVSVCYHSSGNIARFYVEIRYVRVYLRLFSVFNSWIFDKSFRSEVMA